jgi:hypothetical protein
MIQVMTRPKKRLFLALILTSLLITALSTYGLWQVSFPGLANISSYLPVVLGILLAAVLCAVAVGVIGEQLLTLVG